MNEFGEREDVEKVKGHRRRESINNGAKGAKGHLFMSKIWWWEIQKQSECKKKRKLPCAGLEPTTNGLLDQRSTD